MRHGFLREREKTEFRTFGWANTFDSIRLKSVTFFNGIRTDMRIRKKHISDKILIRKGDLLRVPSKVPGKLTILTFTLAYRDDGSWHDRI